MMRWVWFSICAVLGLVAILFGLLVPAHLRAVDATVLQQAGRDTPDLITHGLVLATERNLGAAQLLQWTAHQRAVPGKEKLDHAVTALTQQHPKLQLWGSQPHGRVSALRPPSDAAQREQPAGVAPEPLTEYVVRFAQRRQVLDLLEESPNLAVQELLRFRSLTNTVVFPPSSSSAGQALDAAIAVCGLLLEAGHLTPGLSREIFGLVAEANRGGNTEKIEETLLATLSLGQRLNWGQLVALVTHVEDAETLRQLAELARSASEQLPVLFAAVQVSGRPDAVAAYLTKFSQTGLRDLGSSLRFGEGGVRELMERGRQLYDWRVRRLALGYDPFGSFVEFAAALDWRAPWVALPLKWVLYLAGGFLIAAALHFGRRPPAGLEEPLQVRGFHLAREFLFALGFLLVVLLLSEPFLAQGSQKTELPFRLRLPTVGNVIPTAIASAPASFMNQMSLLTLLLFFVIQALIYTACRVKLAEIRRQRIPPGMKLKLLENEDHLFDAGLYLGFVGTIISLILVSLGIIKPSLMAAYSSTSFGIIFVSGFKIFNLRPLRRKLLLEAEAALPTSSGPSSPQTSPALSS